MLKFVTWSNWILLVLGSIAGIAFMPQDVAIGILAGGLLVTVNFHLLYRTLKKTFTPPHIGSYKAVIAKYYVRFVISGIVIFILISGNFVNPLGLIAGLSVVVASIMMATVIEIKNLFFKEAM